MIAACGTVLKNKSPHQMLYAYSITRDIRKCPPKSATHIQVMVLFGTIEKAKYPYHKQLRSYYGNTSLRCGFTNNQSNMIIDHVI